MSLKWDGRENTLSFCVVNMKPLSVFTALAVVFLYMIPIGYEFNIQNVVHSSLPNLTQTHATLLLASWPLGAILGSILLPFTIDWIPLKFSLFIITNIIMIIGGVSSTFSTPWTLILGRLIFGVGAGMATTILPIYTVAVCDSWLLGGWVNCAFWLGSSMASGLGLDTVLGGEAFWPYLALMAPFMAAMTIVLSPLFPPAPPSIDSRFHMGKRLEFESLLIESLPPPWSWRDGECRRLAIGSILLGLSWGSLAPLPMFGVARPILTMVLGYSQHVAGAIEACVAVIYACSALLSFSLLFLTGWKKSYLLLALVICWLGYLVSIIFTLLTTRGATDGWTGKMGVLFSFLICALAYHTVLAPNMVMAPIAYCHNDHRRVWCYSMLHASLWTGFLIWTQSFSALAPIIGGWSLLPYLAISFGLTVLAYVYWRRTGGVHMDSSSSFYSSLSLHGNGSGSKASNLSYGTFGQAKGR